MNENISPLARRIAEENNVNWRSLTGSGPDGRIVERDVIAYLQRVTAGAEPVDPTPEPLPEGMAAWPEEDVAAYRQEQRQEPEDDFVETDLGDMDLVDMDLGEEDLLDIDDLDDGLASGGPSSRNLNADHLSADHLNAEGLLETEHEAPAPQPRADDDFVAELDWSSPEEEEELGFDFGPPARAEAPERAAPEPAFEPEPELEADVEPEPEPELEAEPEIELEQALEPGPPTAPLEEVAVTLEESETEREEQVFLESAPAEASWRGWERPAPPEAEEALASREEALDAREEALDAPPEIPSEAPLEAPAEAPLEAAPAPLFAPARAAQEQPDFLQTLPLMRSGLMVRAQVDLTPIVEAQAAVSRSLGEEDAPIATAFLLRAAAKALEDHPLGEDGAPALALISEEGFGAARIAGAASASFRELLQELATLPEVPAGDIEEAGVLVANLSDFDLDEAVLVVGMPVLALGRVFYDSGEDSYSSTLTLSGDLMPAQAAAFLGRVAELLSSPLELIL